MSPQLIALFDQYKEKKAEHDKLKQDLWKLRDTIDHGLKEEGYPLRVFPVREDR